MYIYVKSNLRERWCLHHKIKRDMVGNINQEKNTTKIKALFAVHKHNKILHCDNHCP